MTRHAEVKPPRLTCRITRKPFLGYRRPPNQRDGDKSSSCITSGLSGTILRSLVSVIVISILMRLSATSQRILASDTGILVLSALSVVALHTATNGEYGFHRDELATIDDARFLGWGYVVYPPVTPFIARVSLTLFGASMIGLRFFAALAVGIAMVLTGLMARELGGRSWWLRGRLRSPGPY